LLKIVLPPCEYIGLHTAAIYSLSFRKTFLNPNPDLETKYPHTELDLHENLSGCLEPPVLHLR